MFSNLTNLWDTAKQAVKGPGPESDNNDSDNTEGPDSQQPSPTTEKGPIVSEQEEGVKGGPVDSEAIKKESPKTENAHEQQNGSADAENGTATKDPHAIQHQMEEMSGKAINSAKEWGSYLYSFGHAASSRVAETVKQVKTTVEEKTILGDFQKEQDKFTAENKEKAKAQDAAVPPWVGYNEEEQMKTQILALSKDQRNFLRNPPAGVQFNFDYNSSSTVAAVMLAEDPGLEKMRFELVPKQVTEEQFWRNYFYRVSLIKQSAQLTSIAQHTGSDKSSSSSRKSSSGSGDKQDPLEMVGSQSKRRSDNRDEEMPAASPPDHEFASDAFQDGGIDEEALRKEMEMMGVGVRDGGEDDVPEWERELAAELNDYEVVVDENADEDLEDEIMKQIEAETNQ